MAGPFCGGGLAAVFAQLFLVPVPTDPRPAAEPAEAIALPAAWPRRNTGRRERGVDGALSVAGRRA